MIDAAERRKLLYIARRSLETAFSGEAMDIPDTDIMRGAFVTLRKGGSLRGCIGYLEGICPLYREIHELSREAAFSDYRFQPVTEDELGSIGIEISVLSIPEAIEALEEFLPGRDGIILSVGGRRAVFLPQVADETGWSREEMLSALSEKAGLPKSAWRSPAASFMTFQAEVFGEGDM